MRIFAPETINYGDPEGRGLVACFVAHPDYGMIDLHRGITGARGGTADPGRTHHSVYDAYFDGVDDSWSFDTAVLLEIDRPITLVWEAELDAFVDGYPALAAIATDSDTPTTCKFGYSNDVSYGDFYFYTGVPGGVNSKANLQAAGVGVTGTRHFGVFTFNGINFADQANYSCYVNGVECALSVPSSFGAVTIENRIGATSNTATEWNGVIRQLRVYTRPWRGAEAARFFHTRGNALYAPLRRPRYSAFSPPPPPPGDTLRVMTTGMQW